VLANGEVEESVKLAERILQVDKNDRIARLVLGVHAIKQKQYPLARKEGSVEIVETISFPNYVGSFSKCNQHKVKGVRPKRCWRRAS
jgi:hypothetical protein